MCVTDRHDMTLAVKVALNPSTTNQLTEIFINEYVEERTGFQQRKGPSSQLQRGWKTSGTLS